MISLHVLDVWKSFIHRRTDRRSFLPGHITPLHHDAIYTLSRKSIDCAGCVRDYVAVVSPRGPMVTRRMIAYWGVLAAAALTILVTPTVAAAIMVFISQALPLGVRHDLATAPDTAISATALVTGPGHAVQGSAALRARITAAMPGVPSSFQQAFWSDPLDFVPGALPALPESAGQGNTA